MDTLPNQKIKILQKEEIQAEITRCEKLLMELKIKKNSPKLIFRGIKRGFFIRNCH
jgi:hypothetical protein